MVDFRDAIRTGLELPCTGIKYVYGVIIGHVFLRQLKPDACYESNSYLYFFACRGNGSWKNLEAS